MRKMNGITYINGKLNIDGELGDKSVQIQLNSIQKYIDVFGIEQVTINPYQIHSHYTLLHALHHDLHKKDQTYDYLITYSSNATASFKQLYPERWEQIRQYFQEVIEIEDASIEQLG
ncbi:hypothetical protein [Peribacillus alkalitolerans]|uniref:hypothetical protein n=1 Tax=Peribacillus alkalitolerans TaxID=1550385 RepID=UPI0013D5E608|nr:hypothetical protein [Peribacillus alkalitolerans]